MTSPHPTPAPQPAPWWSAGPVTLHVGDAHDVLAAMPDASVDCIVTSPPYWGLRSYDTGQWHGGRADCDHDAAPSPAGAHQARTCSECGAVWTDGQYGQEPTVGEYVDRLVTVFDQARRVLHPQGTLWLNLGDSYAGTGPRAARPHGSNSIIGGNYNHRQWTPGAVAGLRPKNLIGVPWRVALALQSTNNWILRNAAVWLKTNGQPSSARDRLTTTYEMVFLLTRSPRYFFDLDAIRIPLKNPNDRRLRPSAGTRTGSGGTRGHDPTRPRGKNPGDVWPYPTRPLREAHFAAYPIEIPLRCIAAGCRPEGTVLDPFSGAATTGLAALQLGRRYVGVDLSSQYAALAKRRLLSQLPELGEAADD